MTKPTIDQIQSELRKLKIDKGDPKRIAELQGYLDWIFYGIIYTDSKLLK